MLPNLTSFKNFLKRNLIRGVSLEQCFPSLEKYNIVPEECISVSEAKNWKIESPYKIYLENNNYEIKTSAYITVLENVIYCPRYNIILTQNKNIILDSYNVSRDLANFDLKAIFNPRIEKITGYSLIFQQPTNNYYHTVIENIPRFYLSCEHPLIKERKSSVKLLSTVSLFSENRPYQKYYLNPLIPENIVETIIDKNQNYLIEKLIISTFFCAECPGFIPQIYREDIFNRFLPQRKRNPQKKIYISRQKAYNGRQILNEDELMNELEKKGFKKYLLEKLTLTEQIELFYDADTVVAPHGAGLTNLLFAEKAKVIELFPTPEIKPHYYYLAKSMGHTYHYWCGNGEKISNAFTVNVNQVLDFIA